MAPGDVALAPVCHMAINWGGKCFCEERVGAARRLPCIKVRPARDTSALTPGANMQARLCLGASGDCSVPRLVTRDQHPLRCGVLGKLYSRHDYVAPICDVMALLHSSVNGFGIGSIVRTARKEEQRSRKTVVSFGPTTTHTFQAGSEYPASTPFAIPFDPVPPSTKDVCRPKVLCQGCKTTDERKFLINAEGFRVCECGVEAGYAEYGVDYKETHGTERSEARADVPCQHGRDDRRSKKVAPASRAREEGSSVVPDSVKKKNKLGFAAETVASSVPKKGPAMTKGQARKLTNVIDAINKLSTQIGPVDEQIMKRVRCTADSLYCKSVEHSGCCNRGTCHLGLFDKPVRVIACKAFEYTIEKASKGEGIDGVTKQTLTALQGKIESSHVFNTQDNAAQNTSCIGMLAALDSEEANQACRVEKEAAPPLKRKADSSEGCPLASMKRQNSDISSSPICQVRDAISKISSEFCFGSAVRDSAIGALMDSSVSKAIKSNSIVPETAGKYATAYVVLRSVVARRGEKHDDAAHSARVGLVDKELKQMVSKMSMLMPSSTVGSSSADDEDLY